jgi:hypothetical protein
MFNPIPKDAPEFFSDRAHYIDCKITSSRSASENHRSRFYVFSIGRSIKNYHLRDKYFDDKALAILEKAREKKKRLVIKGYSSPSFYGSSMFVVLTHIGIYHRLSKGYMVVNPDTGEEGFYELTVV